MIVLVAGVVGWPVLAVAGIVVRDGQFVQPGGRVILPRGFNYIRLYPGRSHDTFDPEHYDPAAAERAMRRWRADKFNVVRVFINTAAHVPGTIAQKEGRGLSGTYVANIADFLARARQNEIGVMLCTESYPRVAPYSDGLRKPGPMVSVANAVYLEAGHVGAKAQFLKDLIGALHLARPGCLDAIFSYDLQNEFCFHGGPPFMLDAGSFVASDGKAYALPGRRQDLADDAAIRFIDRMADAIHGVHAGALVSASVFTYAAVGRVGPGDFSIKKAEWQNRIPFRPLAILRSKADFLDLHFYPADAKGWERDLASVEFDDVRKLAKELGKPLLVGEFGGFKRAFQTAESAAVWMGELAGRFEERGFAGWLYWTYDTHEQGDELWHACERDGMIYGQLKRALGFR